MPTQAQAQSTPQIVTLEQEQLNNFLGPVNGALGGLPVAERTSEYFAVFTGAGGTGPEIIDQTAVFISYLVDAKGNLSKPSTEYVSLENLLQNFEIGSNVILRNDAATTTSGNIFGKQKITAIGRQVPLLYSATGSTAGAHVDGLSFGNDINQLSVPNMLGNMTKPSFSPTSAYQSWFNLENYNNPTYSPDSTAANYTPSNGRYTIVSTTAVEDIQFIKFKVLGEFQNSLNAALDVQLRIRRNGQVLATKTYTIPALTDPDAIQQGEQGDGFLNIGNGNDPFEHVVLNSGLTTNAQFDLQIRFPAAPQNIDVSFIQFQVSAQSPEGGLPTSETPFWTNNTGANDLWITASAGISANYGNIQNSDPVTDLASANNFNLSDIETPLQVKAGDRIRFEYNMDTDYIIYDVIEPSSDPEGLLRLKLNQKPPASVNKDNFILHRTDSNDPVYIILDVIKSAINPPNTPFRGVMLPEYPTKELKDNIDDLVLELKEKGILPDE